MRVESARLFYMAQKPYFLQKLRLQVVQNWSLRCLCDKVLDVVQPPDVLLLLLVVNVVGDEERQAGVDAALLEVLLEEDLEVLVEVVEGGTGVQSPPRPVLLGGLGVGELGIGEVVQVLDQEVAVLGGGLDGESTLAGALDADACVSGEALLKIALALVLVIKLLAVLGGDTDVAVLGGALGDSALGVGATRLDLHVGIVVHGLVLDTVLRVDVVVKVGGGEGNADLLVAEGAGQNDFLVAGLVLNLSKVSELTKCTADC